ncbi:MAG: hypothetical protein QG553_294 [Patescibacteria group bacterium]|nr:hypothetical protein [Patescibacteria group bacterium]
MQLVGSNPFALTQPSGARGIHTLMPFGGKLYAGFGDWISNTGPVEITSWNGSSWTSEFTAKTESIVRYRVLNGKLFLPYIDPRTSYHNDFAVLEAGGWTEYRTGPGPNEATLHTFDMTYFAGQYWGAGAATDDNKASVHRSADYTSGSWTRSSFGTPNSEDRIYTIWQADGNLYCRFSTGPGVVFRWNGSAWVDSGLSNTNAPGWNTETFGAKTAYTNAFNGGSADKVRTFDSTNGVQTWDNAGNTYALCVSGSYVYALADAGTAFKQVLRSTDLVTWTPIALPPSDCESIAIWNNAVYVGTTNGAMYSHTLS